MSCTRVLVTGFEPFAGFPRNPSQDVVLALARHADPRVATAVLPVDRRRATAHLMRLLARHRPRTLVMTGLAAGRSAVGVERIAVNCFREPGDRGRGGAVVRGGPDGLFSTIPLGTAVQRLEAGGVPAEISESAGTFCCNLVLYRALLWSKDGLPDGTPGPVRCGFVHLPATPESLPAGRNEPCLPLGAMTQALRSLCWYLAGARAPSSASNATVRPGRGSR